MGFTKGNSYPNNPAARSFSPIFGFHPLQSWLSSGLWHATEPSEEQTLPRPHHVLLLAGASEFRAVMTIFEFGVNFRFSPSS